MREIRIEAIQADITHVDVDAIVNAANSTLLGGGGVDGAIHRAAGHRLLDACRELGGCPPGEARITPGFDLPARWVIHTVGPIWSGGAHDEPEVLRRCYENSLAIAVDRDLVSIAFPSISTGAFGYPIERAAPIAIDAVREHFRGDTSLQVALFVCFGADHFQVYRQLLRSSA